MKGDPLSSIYKCLVLSVEKGSDPELIIHSEKHSNVCNTTFLTAYDRKSYTLDLYVVKLNVVV